MSKNITIVDPLRILELSDRELLQIGATYQQLYWETGKIPSVDSVYEALNRALPKNKILEYAESEAFQEKLENLGLKTDTPVVGYILTPEQILCANLELTLFDKRSMRTKVDEIKTVIPGLTLAKFEAWRRDPAYQDYLAKRSKALFENIESLALQKLYENVQAGDQKAITMALEMSGKYQKTVGLNINLESLSAKLIEIIVRHVDDPEIIDAISVELEELEI